ncbi:MAG TPA: 4-hydroxybenzoate polyprenyltransferase [Nitrospirales bacterium]|nr:4-hydroxybenzoate polyprenyltransferase [Nitrospirales bacterium]HIC04227.1 4-hydroxybenzoate polyprenyltransferase [Nitrospirales bacterium]HIN32392.1 4-hydroxybenzoate polyprenyltransferase [Nitrospirales bacterium]
MAVSLTSKMQAIADLIRLQNQSGTVLLMMPCLWSLVLASGGQPTFLMLAIFVIGAFVMRSAGCVINDLVDQDIDREVERTRHRPLPSGRLSRTEAGLVLLVLLAVAALLLAMLNVVTLLLGLGAVVLVVLYPFAKRIIAMPQAVLGIAFGWGVLMAWAAVRGTLELPAILIFFATVFWAIGYDTIYAIQDQEDDRRIGVGSSALLFGRFTWLAIALVFSGMIACLASVGFIGQVGNWYTVALVLVSFVMAVQVAMIRRGLNRREAFDMFRSHAGIGVAILIGLVIGLIGDSTVRVTGPTMGTSYAVTLHPLPEGIERDALQTEIDRILVRINNRMSTYQEHSELSRFNQNQTIEWVDVSAELFTVVDAAVHASRMTHGAFDATVGWLVNLWGFGPSIPTTIVPSDTAISEVMRATGYEHLHLNPSPPALRKDVPELYVDLSGIAKGYAVDHIAEYLDSVGIENYLVEIGGELRANGKRQNGMTWEVVIERPTPLVREKHRAIKLRNRAIATSGNYRNYIERDGKRFSHILNPNTGKPITHNLASVTVIRSSSMEADALATGLMVLGPDAGYDVAVKEDVAALFLVKHEDGLHEIVTPALDRYLDRK